MSLPLTRNQKDAFNMLPVNTTPKEAFASGIEYFRKAVVFALRSSPFDADCIKIAEALDTPPPSPPACFRTFTAEEDYGGGITAVYTLKVDVTGLSSNDVSRKVIYTLTLPEMENFEWIAS